MILRAPKNKKKKQFFYVIKKKFQKKNFFITSISALKPQTTDDRTGKNGEVEEPKFLLRFVHLNAQFFLHTRLLRRRVVKKFQNCDK